MATKREGVACYDKAGNDEPIFVLRAQDMLSPAAVRHWAKIAKNLGVTPEKVAEAHACADAMERWPLRKIPD